MNSQPPHPKQARRLMLLGLLVPCLLIMIPAVLAYRVQDQLARSFHWVSHTLEVQRQLQRLLSLVGDAESSQRGFLLTSRESHLKHYEADLEQMPHQIESLRVLCGDNPVQLDSLAQLETLIGAKRDFMAQTIALQREGRHDAVVTLVGTDRGGETMDAVRARLEMMEHEEARLLGGREEQLALHAKTSTGILFALVALNFIFAAAVFVMFRRLSKAKTLVTVCAWSRTIEYRGEWLSFEEYLLRRFNVDTSHSISPAEAQKAMESLDAAR